MKLTRFLPLALCLVFLCGCRTYSYHKLTATEETRVRVMIPMLNRSELARLAYTPTNGLAVEGYTQAADMEALGVFVGEALRRAVEGAK